MKFKIFSTEINVSFFFMAVLTLALIIDKTGFILPVFLATAFHEVGHLAAMFVLHCQPKKINLIPGSIQIVSGFGVKTQGEFFILLSGPLSNLLFAALAFVLYYFLRLPYLISFSAVNLLIFAFNMLPVRGLDGGSILYLTLSKILSNSKCEVIVDILSLLCGVLAVFLGVSGILMGKINLSLAVLGLYVIIGVIIKM
ncbi:MAG: hypothetical protein IJX79_04195 [Clostridia bacterium]|nr:hypothetical protein [Clostridia bacterium]